MNEIKICDKCRMTNVKTLIPKIKNIDPKADIQIGCMNFCGIGQRKAFAIVNNIPIIKETEEELIEALTEKLS